MIFIRALGYSVLLGLAVGCTTGAPTRPPVQLPTSARESPGRHLVVTINNETPPGPPARAASTPRGYDAVALYTSGGAARRAARALATEYHLQAISSWPIQLLGVHCVAYRIPDGADADALMARLARDRRVESVQALLSFETAADAYNDPYANLQHNLRQMAVLDAQTFDRGARVRVAIIDTGFDAAHPDLPREVVMRNFVDVDAAAFQADTHGTAIVGVIAAVPNNGVGIAGIAPDVRVFAYKACWGGAAAGIKAACNSFTLAQALAAAIDDRVDVINLSLAGPSDPLLTRLVERALARGIIVVGAVPLDGTRRTFPTDIEGVVAVDAAENGHTSPQVLKAPGRDIVSLAPHGHYDFYSGSSLATAEITGLIALLRAQSPHLAGRDAQALLAAAADRSDEGAAPNVCKALASLPQAGRCPTH